VCVPSDLMSSVFAFLFVLQTNVGCFHVSLHHSVCCYIVPLALTSEICDFSCHNPTNPVLATKTHVVTGRD
jgi:hypothetical protein